jgi:hypothetical protein
MMSRDAALNIIALVVGVLLPAAVMIALLFFL